ncbi:hypothetical protein J5N97_009697 [Dioscorea zingiberensis]|uniref:Uncharacterized protein n=1 Tax=Dioscorea zingiberensis TaxID=325984 RepID=A0A9D5CYT1_9LILI|nr:hypothetical protein J5N97_009697 [Dioscorea zingiberensis]
MKGKAEDEREMEMERKKGAEVLGGDNIALEDDIPKEMKNFDEVKAIYGVDKEGSNNHHPYDLGAYENFKTVCIKGDCGRSECFRSVPVTTAIVSNPLDPFNKVAAALMMTDLLIYELMDLKYLHFLASQFVGQEPGSKEETKEVVCAMFKAEFPIFDKVRNSKK